MDRSIPMLFIGLLFGGGIGFTIAASNGVVLEGHDHANPAHHGSHTGHDSAAADHEYGGHDHGAPLVLGADEGVPGLSVAVLDDPGGGWNLHAQVSEFTFAPERASTDHVPGEGHAHLYINGEKVGRLYGPWVHVPAGPGTSVAVRIALYTNDHRPIHGPDGPVAAELDLHQP